MNSKSVLNKILTLLSLEEQINFTDAKDAQGNILQSPTFDLGETVEVIHEDGSKTPAPDGEHEIALKDSEGNDVVIRITTKDGKIESRENVEEANPAELEKTNEEVVDKEADKVAEEKDVTMADATIEEAHPLPNTTDEDPRNQIADDSEETEKDPLISLGYRISEMEKAMDAIKTKLGLEDNPPMEEESPSDVAPLMPEGVAMAEVDEEELPKLDGAPIEAGFRFSADTVHKPNFGKKVGDSQSSFLSKLYN
jgi:hypothetical protein